MYSREAILEYLLREMQELKAQQALYDQEQKLKAMKEAESGQRTELLQLKDFEANNLGIGGVVQRYVAVPNHHAFVWHKVIASLFRGFTEPAIESEHSKSRKRHIDDTDREEKLKSLKAVCPWVPQFTPSAPEAATKAPAKRPSSPFSGRPMRTKDLIPVSLIREESSDTSGPVRFICPVSRKTITNAKVVLIKSTGTLMLESSAKETSYKTMRDPLTNKPFTMDDVLELVPAASGFAASGSVEAKHYRPSMN
jgi:nitric oxide synthase-interacting protein